MAIRASNWDSFCFLMAFSGGKWRKVLKCKKKLDEECVAFERKNDAPRVLWHAGARLKKAARRMASVFLRVSPSGKSVRTYG